MKRGALLLAILVVQLANGDDLYWRPNSNWNNPSNWKLGRVPCGGIISIPEHSIIYLNEDVSFQSIILPENGEIILGSNIAVTLSEDSQCGEDGIDTNPAPTSLPGRVNNEFIGPTNNYWECSGNWLTENNFPAEHPPCGNDNAIFEEDLYFHSVTANETISVRSLQVRGRQIFGQKELDAKEFQLLINIIPDCGTNPSLCPCPSDQGCFVSGPGVVGSQTGSMPVGVIVGIVIGTLFGLLLIAAVVVIVIFVIIKYRNKGVGYKKDDFLEYEEQGQPKDSLSPNSRNFDNPVYESTTLTPGDVQLTGYQETPKLDFKGSDSNLNPEAGVYEVVREVKVSPDEDEFVKVDLGAMAEAVEVPPTSGAPDLYQPSNEVDSEMVEDSEKKKGKKQGKYERF